MLRENNNFYYSDGEKSERPKKKSEMLAAEKEKLRFFKMREKLNGCSADLTSKITHQEKKIEHIKNRRGSSRIKRTYKKPPKDLYKQIKIKVLEAKSEQKMFISAEELAFTLKIKPHYVKQVLQKLNHEGLITQAKHIIPHDCNREPTIGGGFSSWEPSKYFIIYKEKENNHESN